MNDTVAAAPGAVGLVFDDRYLQHDPGIHLFYGSGLRTPFVEPVLSPTNHRMVLNTKYLIDASGLGEHLARIHPEPATLDDLALFHTRDYIEHVRATCAAGGGELGRDTPVGPRSFAVACLSAGGALAAVDAVMRGPLRRVYALIRPPGHHAVSDQAIGFCVFNNVAIAARRAQRHHGLRRILIVDWDVHPGNGTQAAFYDDPDVLFVSLHQEVKIWNQLAETGSGPGVGFNVNVPLPAGCGDAAYRATFERIVIPIADEFQPELVLVSAGQDASIFDPEARMGLSPDGYRFMTTAMIDVAERHARGRLALVQEGGYSELYAPYCNLAIVETLMERRTGMVEPLSTEELDWYPHREVVGPSAEAALAEIASCHSRYWSAVSVAGS